MDAMDRILSPAACQDFVTAAELHGLGGLRSDDTMHVSLPGVARHAGVRPDPAYPSVVVGRWGRDVARRDAVTTPVRTAADVILRVDRYAAVSLLDSGLNRDSLKPQELTRVEDLIAGSRGAAVDRRSG